MKFFFRLIGTIRLYWSNQPFGKKAALHQLISIVLQLSNQGKNIIPAISCGAKAIFKNFLWRQDLQAVISTGVDSDNANQAGAGKIITSRSRDKLK